MIQSYSPQVTRYPSFCVFESGRLRRVPSQDELREAEQNQSRWSYRSRRPNRNEPLKAPVSFDAEISHYVPSFVQVQNLKSNMISHIFQNHNFMSNLDGIGSGIFGGIFSSPTSGLGYLPNWGSVLTSFVGLGKSVYSGRYTALGHVVGGGGNLSFGEDSLEILEEEEESYLVNGSGSSGGSGVSNSKNAAKNRGVLSTLKHSIFKPLLNTFKHSFRNPLLKKTGGLPFLKNPSAPSATAGFSEISRLSDLTKFFTLYHGGSTNLRFLFVNKLSVQKTSALLYSGGGSHHPQQRETNRKKGEDSASELWGMFAFSGGGGLASGNTGANSNSSSGNTNASGNNNSHSSSNYTGKKARQPRKSRYGERDSLKGTSVFGSYDLLDETNKSLLTRRHTAVVSIETLVEDAGKTR
jgi:hypothetical protein